MDYEEALQRVRALVERYRQYAVEYARADSEYNETQVRVDYLNPLLECLGWDVNNVLGLPTFLRDVRQEFSLAGGDENQGTRPDYAIRTFGTTRYFIEAKRPSVRLSAADGPARQVRRYGWTEGLAVSVVTNFAEFAVYDCSVPPQEDDDLRQARLSYIGFDEYVERFDELWLFSRESVVSGAFEQFYSQAIDARLSEPFDEYFLRQLNEWRLLLGNAVLGVRPDIDADDLNYVVQQLINRILFLRIAEDRRLEDAQRLQAVQEYADLVALFQEAEARYDSGLFDFVRDTFTPTLGLPSRAVAAVLADLYYPNSPFDFSVLDATTIGQVYEVFLGQRLAVVDGVLTIMLAPEVAASQSKGVVATPPGLVRRIVHTAMAQSVLPLELDELLEIRILDMSCGSGPFLTAAYEYVMDHALDLLVAMGEQAPLRPVEIGPDTWQLPFELRRLILSTCICGVDIDPCAVELARFALLLKLLEGVSADEIDSYMRSTGARALPDIASRIAHANSIVGGDFGRLYIERSRDDQRMELLKPSDWQDLFPEELELGGFDVIIGNPPYVRIQNMRQYAADEMDYLQNPGGQIQSARQGNGDKYYAFIERSAGLLAPGGHAAFVVKNAFMYVASAQVLRGLLTAQPLVASIADFGTQLVFGDRQVYTCVLHLSKAAAGPITVEEIRDVPAWVQGVGGLRYAVDRDRLTEGPWLLAPPEVLAVFDKLYSGTRVLLADVAPPFVGVQTSADDVYIIRDGRRLPDGLIEFTDRDGMQWAIEAEALRPVLYDVVLQPYAPVEANALIIFPYDVGETAVVIGIDEMRARYPRTLTYLEAHRERLETRSVNGGPADVWYRYGRSQGLTKFNGRPKVIWPTLSRSPKYALDVSNTVFTGGGNGPYYAFRSTTDGLDDRYLMAVMSHPIVDSLVVKLASAFRGDYASHGKEFVENVPIPAIVTDEERETHDRVVQGVQALNELMAALPEAPPLRRGVIERAAGRELGLIESAIDSLYGFTAEDLDVVGRYMRGEWVPVEAT